VQKLNHDGLLLAYHDRSDGGLFVAACEMAFASRRGVSLDLDGICYDAGAGDVDGSEKRPDLLAGRDFENIVRALFNEELGALIQIRRADREKVTAVLRALRVPTISSVTSTNGTKSASPATPSACCARSASTCNAPGRKPATRCRRCATTRAAPSRNSTASSTPPTPA
jgi:phosphoribosylformylglycinamidine (FGAM) synthase-like enzyme